MIDSLLEYIEDLEKEKTRLQEVIKCEKLISNAAERVVQQLKSENYELKLERLQLHQWIREHSETGEVPEL